MCDEHCSLLSQRFFEDETHVQTFHAIKLVISVF
jgi:hypothetical protein